MNEDKPKNIFEAAGKAKKPAPSKGAVPSPSPKKEGTPPPEVNLNPPKELVDLHRDPEINEMLNKMFSVQENFQTQLNEIYDSSGISTNQIKNYLNNPGNFSPDMWQKIQGQRDVLEKKMGDVLKTYAKKRTKGHIAQGKNGLSKERKSKTLGTRKNWIPM